MMFVAAITVGVRVAHPKPIPTKDTAAIMVDPEEITIMIDHITAANVLQAVAVLSTAGAIEHTVLAIRTKIINVRIPTDVHTTTITEAGHIDDRK